MSPACSASELLEAVRRKSPLALGRAITLVEEGGARAGPILAALDAGALPEAATLGLTGTGGAGKSTLAGRLIDRWRAGGRRVGLIAVDPSSPVSGGAILGDRVRMMRHACDRDVVIRSMASRGRLGGLSAATAASARLMKLAGCDPVLVETVGVGQAELDIVRLADLTALVLAPGLGDDIQAMKAGLIEVADLLVINKGDLPGAEALRRDLESIARERGRPLLKVSAREGEGVEALVSAIDSRFDEFKNNGELERRRSRSNDAEALDWALEMAREVLDAALQKQPPELKAREPRARAAAVVGELFGQKEAPTGQKK